MPSALLLGMDAPLRSGNHFSSAAASIARVLQLSTFEDNPSFSEDQESSLRRFHDADR
jgi:hypothetical protein